MGALPKDPMILLSYVNTQLRDNYSSLDEMCSGVDADKSEILDVLSAAGFEYDAEQNRFR